LANQCWDKIAGMDSWYLGFGGSNYAGTSDEYTGTNGQVTSSVSYGGHFVDSTAASGGNKVSPILAEVCKVIPSPVANGYTPFTRMYPAGVRATVHGTATGAAAPPPSKLHSFSN
jgi:hypothetical protein